MHKNIVKDDVRGDIICTDCAEVLDRVLVQDGYMVKERFDNTKFFNNNKSKQWTELGFKVGLTGNTGSSIGYNFGYYQKDCNNKIVSQSKILRLQKYNNNNKIQNNETLYRCLTELHNVSQKLEINPAILERTAFIYRKIVKNKENRITSNILLIALCLYLSIRENKVIPIKLDELIEAFKQLGHRVTIKGFNDLYMKLRPRHPDIIKVNQRKSEDYVPRILSSIINSDIIKERLGIFNINVEKYEKDLRDLTYKILEKVNRKGRRPFTWTVSVVYTADKILAEKESRKVVLTQKILSDCCGCAEYTIRDCWRDTLMKVLKSF
jgi:transcription initiation factor TFIIIB Brf1 subunit/transcription initiation factor TFIIB